MGRQSDPRKAAAWERRLGCFGELGLTVARFCDRVGVSIATCAPDRLGFLVPGDMRVQG